jgi:hypothetical protein
MLKIRLKVCCHFGRTSQRNIVSPAILYLLLRPYYTVGGDDVRLSMRHLPGFIDIREKWTNSRHWKYHLFFDIISYHIICQKNDIISFITAICNVESTRSLDHGS